MSGAGKMVRDARLAAGLGLRELCVRLRAQRVSLSPTMLSRWETGAESCPPREETLVAIARTVGLDADVLLCAAGRVPSDVRALLLSDPSLIALLRGADTPHSGADRVLRAVSIWGAMAAAERRGFGLGWHTGADDMRRMSRTARTFRVEARR